MAPSQSTPSWAVNRLRGPVATLVVILWTWVVYKAAGAPELIPLATVVTPIMGVVVGWLFAGEYLRKRGGGANEEE